MKVKIHEHPKSISFCTSTYDIKFLFFFHIHVRKHQVVYTPTLTLDTLPSDPRPAAATWPAELLCPLHGKKAATFKTETRKLPRSAVNVDDT